MSHSVRSHLSLEIDAYDDTIRKFIPGYAEGLTRAAKEIAGARPTLVIDLGAGTGALAEAMLEHERVGSVEAIDIDPEMLAQARIRLKRFGTRARFRRCSFDAPLPKCDAVATSLALHHVLTMERKLTLYERIYRALRLGGVFVNADVPFPAVGVDRAVGLDSLLDEAVQLLLGRFADALHTDPSYPRAVFLGGDGYQCFFLRLPSAQSLFCAPHIGLVDLHATAEPFSAGPHHRAPQLVQQRPGGTVASQTQDALQSQCAHPVFLAGHPPHGPKPGAQRQARVLENRARRHRSLIIALPTPQQAPPAGPSSPPSTAGTHKTLWPAQLHQILATRLLSGKTPLKLLQRPRVVLHSPACYMLGSRESSAYPDKIKLVSHRAFGFRSVEHYVAAIYHCCAQLPLPQRS